MSCILIGQSPIAPCLEYKAYRDTQGIIQSVPVLNTVNTDHGMLGLTLSMIQEISTTPTVSSSEFIADLGQQIGIKSANAQVSGSGGGVLAPIFKLWEVSRNIAYLAMILIFVFVGIMVMFRQRLNPQTVISVQMALPGLVIGLVMITFSYFLASLISDVAFLGTNVVAYYFSLAQPEGSTVPITSPLLVPGTNKEENILSIFSRYIGIIGYGDVVQGLGSVISNLNPSAQFILRLFSAFITAQFVLPIAGAVPPPFGLFVSPAITILAGVLGAVTPESVFALALYFIAAAVLMYSMFKLLFKLISNLLNIIFLTIASPFYFLMASLPGRQGIATSWFLNMLCYVLAFPAVFAVFYFVAFILKSPHPDIAYEPFRIASGTSVTGNAAFPLLGGINLNIVNLLLAFGALVASPAVPDVICKVIGKLGPAGAMLGSEIQGDIRSGQGYYNQQAGAMRQVGSNTKRNLFGDSAFRHDGKGFTYGQTAPGALKNNVNTMGQGWRFWKWKVK